MKLSWLMAVLALAVRASGESCSDMYWAAKYGHTKVVQRLLRSGVHVDCRVWWDKTALRAAAEEGHPEIAELLLRHGATVNAKDIDGETPLYKAANNGHLQVVKLLVSHGADVNAKNDDGDTPLHSAAYQGHEQVAKLLISLGADVNAKDDDGKTPLHHAASQGQLEMVKLLVKHGGRVEDAFVKSVPIKFLARLVGKGSIRLDKVFLPDEHLMIASPHKSLNKGSIRLDKVFRCDEDLMIALPQENILVVNSHLTRDCLGTMSQTVAKFWFEHGGNPWTSTPDGVRYVQVIEDGEVRKFWQTHMTRSSLLQHTAADPNAWTTFSGGFLAAGFVLLLQKLLQKCQSPYRLILEDAATEPSFRMGARLLVAKHLGKSRKMIRLAWRLLEVMVNVVCQFGVVMLLVWWPFFLPFYGLAFACPGLRRWGMKLLQNPPLMVASVTPDDRLVSGLRLVVVSCVAGLASLGFRNPLLASGELLDTKMSFLQEQHIELPWWLPMNPSWLPWWHHGTSLVTSWSALDLVKWLFWVPTLVLSAMYFVATFLYSVLATIGETGFLQLSHAGFPPFVQRDMVRKVLEEQPSSEADGTPVIAVDGVRFTAEVGFSVYRFFESIWTKVFLVLLDIILDVNTVFTLISAQQYRTAFALQLVVSYSLLQQVMTGQIQKIFEAACASAARGLLRDDLIALLHQEKGFEAYFSLAITSYSLLFAVSTAAQIPVQVFSILLSVHGLATFLYEQVDLELAEDDEDLTSREFLRLEGVDRA